MPLDGLRKLPTAAAVVAVAAVAVFGLLCGASSQVGDDLTTSTCQSPDDYTYPLGSCQPEISTEQITSGQVTSLADTVYAGESETVTAWCAFPQPAPGTHVIRYRNLIVVSATVP